MFHLSNGFFFERQADGQIRVAYVKPKSNEPMAETIVSPEAWASVLATTSVRGESAETWQEARDFLAAEWLS